MYEIYCLTFKTTGKKYVGFTGKGVMNRLHKHYVNAHYGIDNHLYRAIRCYGIEDVIIEVLFASENKEEALAKEAFFIAKLDTVNNGYNMTVGGSGGWSVPIDKLEAWKRKLRKHAKGSNNPNSNSVSNEDILEEAVRYFLSHNNRLIRTHWMAHCKERGLPQQYTKYRFGGGYANFLKAFKQKLLDIGIPFTDDSFALSYEERYKMKVGEIYDQSKAAE